MKAAVLGKPIVHSLSPALHRAAYRELGLDDWTYDLVECDEAGLPGYIESRGREWAGLSLTMPLKRTVLPLLDHVDFLLRFVIDDAADKVLQLDRIALILEQGRENGSFPWIRDVKADARAIAAVLRHAFDEQIARPGVLSSAEAAEHVVDFALRALGAAAVRGPAPADAGPERSAMADPFSNSRE